MSLHFRKWDIAMIAAVLLLAVFVLLLFLPKAENGAYAEVYQDGKLLFTVSLEEDQEFLFTNHYSNTIRVQDGAIAIVASTCPGEDCVACGWIHSSGRSIVCLPNGLEIRVVGKNGDVDFVVG